MRTKFNRRFQLRGECLEPRCQMAGDVAVALEGSLLTVMGDNLANEVTISQATTGDVVVSGQNGTLINGRASVRFVRPALNAMEVRMEGGNDVVSLRGLQIANDLFVDLGAGADRLTTAATVPITVGANAQILGSEGDDVIRLAGATVREDLYIDGGLGLLNANLTDVTVDKAMAIIADEANDIISVARASVGDGVSIETKGGSDRVTLTDLLAYNLAVNTDANSSIGRDIVNLNRVTTQEDLGIFTGDGADTINLTQVTSNKSIIVSTDAGNDLVTATNVRAAVDAVFEGGSGVDTIDDNGIFAGVKKEIKEFEFVL